MQVLQLHSREIPLAPYNASVTVTQYETSSSLLNQGLQLLNMEFPLAP